MTSQPDVIPSLIVPNNGELDVMLCKIQSDGNMGGGGGDISVLLQSISLFLLLSPKHSGSSASLGHILNFSFFSPVFLSSFYSFSSSVSVTLLLCFFFLSFFLQPFLFLSTVFIELQ